MPSQRNGFVLVEQIWHSKAWNLYSITQKIRFRSLRDFNLNSSGTPIKRKRFSRLLSLVSLSQKNGFVFVDQIWHSKASNQYQNQLRRFDLSFWQTPKQIYRQLQYKEKLFEEFQCLPHFPREMVLYWSTKFGILKPWTNILSLLKFDSWIWQTSKQIHRKLQYREKGFGEFWPWPSFPRKIVLYSSTKFGIPKTWTNILWPRRFDLVF